MPDTTSPAPDQPADPTAPAVTGVPDDAPAPIVPLAQLALADAVREVEAHVAADGWDAPPRVFALVRTADAIAANPGLADQLPPEVVTMARALPDHLVSVEQEGLPAVDTLEDMLAGISWPDTVDGAAIVAERVILPPSAEEGLPADPAAALAYLSSHPDRQDVRLAVGVLRDGTPWCAVRTRANDADDDVAFGPDLVPGLVEGLRATFE
ncbi:PPA1309 family protein [Oerskovia turbata]